jgi:hypothetical protein
LARDLVLREDITESSDLGSSLGRLTLIVIFIIVVLIIKLARVLGIWRWSLVTATLLLLTTNMALQQIAKNIAKLSASRPNMLAERTSAMQVNLPLWRFDLERA